jgi:4-aminobutyrate aminotransferase/(S)-3-amino-2-methylpropionate transaminase
MGDPIRALQAASQISVIKEHSLVEHTASMGDRLFRRLEELAEDAGKGKMSNLRGKGDGTFIAWDMPSPAARDTLLRDMRNLGVNMAGVSGCGSETCESADINQLTPLAAQCGEQTVRLRPMLIFSDDQGDVLLDRLEQAL